MATPLAALRVLAKEVKLDRKFRNSMGRALNYRDSVIVSFRSGEISLCKDRCP